MTKEKKAVWSTIGTVATIALLSVALCNSIVQAIFICFAIGYIICLILVYLYKGWLLYWKNKE